MYLWISICLHAIFSYHFVLHLIFTSPPYLDQALSPAGQECLHTDFGWTLKIGMTLKLTSVIMFKSRNHKVRNHRLDNGHGEKKENQNQRTTFCWLSWSFVCWNLDLGSNLGCSCHSGDKRPQRPSRWNLLLWAGLFGLLGLSPPGLCLPHATWGPHAIFSYFPNL